jgi:RNA polymerase sigma-70 factor (ECF subfamily)
MLGGRGECGGNGVELALSHMDSLYRTALKLTHDESDAEDLVHEAFLRGYRYFHRLTEVGACKAVLYTIMVNVWRKNHRRGRREVQAAGPFPELPSAAWRDPAHEVAKKTFLTAVDQALHKLPPELRAAVILADVEGFSYQEMADILQCPRGTVMSRLHRARRFLARELSAYADHERGEERRHDVPRA